MKSDHRPLFVTIGHSLPRNRQHHFHYFAGWSQHDDFSRLLRDNWDNSRSLVDNISNFSEVAFDWNCMVFGSTHHRKKALMARLQGVQKFLDRHRSSFFIQLEADLQADLEKTPDKKSFFGSINHARIGFPLVITTPLTFTKRPLLTGDETTLLLPN
ncbi:hypothetical protein V6N13_065290 [Hibiscus sabdariffa]